GAALAALKSNPLPNVLRVVPRPRASGPLALEALRRTFAAWPEVDMVQLDTQWVMRFEAIVALVRRLVLLAAVLLGAGVLAVVGNTIRLEILNRSDEIEVTKLVGGSNSFVRRPFVYTGALYGLGGALLAWLILEGAVLALSGAGCPPRGTLWQRLCVARPRRPGAGAAVRRRHGPRLARGLDLGLSPFAQHRAARLMRLGASAARQASGIT
ncbi:cell division permease protein FtsX, partial [mine drainage metagenome]